MKIKMNLILLFLLIFTVFSNCNERRISSENKNKPNIIIILADDLGYGDISCFNKSRVNTPNIDNLAKEGVRCTDFYVPTPYCAPSRATILTGRFPLRHGIIRNPAPDAGINDIGIKAFELTLGEIFQKAGYRTKCIGKWHLGHREEYFPVKHGFDQYYGILYSNDMRPVQIIENMDTVEYPVDQAWLTQKYTNKALEFIENNRNNPFFLHLCHAMPHKPLAASPDFYTPETPEDLYYDVIRELDWSVGKITEKLKELELLKNTIIIFMSDNGPWYGGSTGGLKGMKSTNWEGGVRVPFIIRYPEEFPGNAIINTPCWSPDILPTLLNISGIVIPDSILLDGQDITEILKGNQSLHKPVFTLHGDKIMSVRDGNWKLFVNKPGFYKPVDLSTWTDPRAPDSETIIAPYEQATPAQYPGIKPEKIEGETFLFNLAEDMDEMKDLSSAFPEIKEKLMDEYNLFLNSLNKEP